MKPMPRGHVEELTVTKHEAAQSQLETAINLWFTGGDPASIHTLAVASHDCFSALIEHRKLGVPEMRRWLDSQPQEIRSQFKVAQNYLKHGFNEIKKSLQIVTIQAEMLMMDGVTCHKLIGGKRTGLMELYEQRFLYEHPSLITEDALPIFAKNAKIHGLLNSTRLEFFIKLITEFTTRYGPPAPHIP